MEEVAQAKESLREIPASEILAKIEKGEPVEYDHIKINGDLDLSKIDLPSTENAKEFIYSDINDSDIIKSLQMPDTLKLVDSPIVIKGCTINGKVIFNAVFHSLVNFERTHFNGYIDFMDAQFNENATFRGINVDGIALFCGAKFCKSTSFMGAYFNRWAYFMGAVFNRKIAFGGDGTTRGAQFRYSANFTGSRFVEEAYFALTKFEMDAYFDGNICFGGEANFRGAQFGGESYFNVATFQGIAKFDEGAKFTLDASFRDTSFNLDAHFMEAEFLRNVDFSNAKFEGDALLGMDIYRRKTRFYGKVNFKNSIFNKHAYIKGADFLGNVASITFNGAKFLDPVSQESVCRLAKKIQEDYGNKEESDYHFYREMEAKRKQKAWYFRYPEFAFIQLIFGYGVHPWWLMGWWIYTIFVFAAFYYIGSGVNDIAQLFDSMKFSFATAVAPGYIATIVNSQNTTGYHLTPMYQAAAMVETVFGTFMWAGFIATFARKYMR